MVKFVVKCGKVHKDGETYREGDVFEMTVKESEKIPQRMIERVPPTAPPEPPQPPEEPPEPDEEPEQPETTEEAKPRVTI